MKYEYFVVNHTAWINEEPDKMNGDWFQDRLDIYGLEGWELCAVDDVHAYFKRVLTDK